MANSLASVPPSTPCVTPVLGTLPVLVSVNVCEGSSAQAICPNNPVPGQFRVWDMVHEPGVKVAVFTARTPVPLRLTGEPAPATLPVIAAVPGAAPNAVGENATVMVQVAPAAKVAPHVPPIWA